VNDSTSESALPSAPRKRTRILRWLAAAVLLFIAWFCWQLFGPSAPIIISKETTYITEPLRPDGLPDYVSYLRDRLRDGVTNDNNAAVLMWQAYGPGQDCSSIKPADWERIVQELNLPAVDPVKYVVEPDNQVLAERVEQWIIAHDAAWKKAFANRPAIQEREPDLGYDAIATAQEFPWRREQLPPLAEWLDAHSDAIDLLVAASRRPKLYTPSAPSEACDEEPELITMALDGLQRAKGTARILATRAMLRLGEKRYADAWHDILAMHRWVRLIEQRPTVAGQLFAIGIDRIAASCTQLLLSEQLPPDLAEEIQDELLALRSPSDIASGIDVGERLCFLNGVVNCSREGIGAFYAYCFPSNVDTRIAGMPAWQIKALNLISADWNQSLSKGNRLYDQFAAATRLASYEDRRRELKRIAAESFNVESVPHNPWNWVEAAIDSNNRSELLATAVVETATRSFNNVSIAEDRANATLSLTRIAAALAVYRAKHGQYPDKLDALVPDVLPQLPVDLYHAKPFVYKRDTDGYLLYSTGENGIDDGGSNKILAVLAGRASDGLDESSVEVSEQIAAGADDIAIRLPRPPFKLPEPSPPTP
jgi:hypothetical protein